MNFNELRKYIMEHINELGDLDFSAKDRENNRNYTAVYLVEKPETHDLASNGLIIKFNEISGGQTVRHFMVEIRILSKEIADIVTIKDGLVNMLDFYNRPCSISRYKKFVFSNEGGTLFDEKINCYSNKLFFDCKLI